MPRYYFNIKTANGLIRDPDGSDLPDLAAARLEAEKSARDLLADLLRDGAVLDGQTFEITDIGGAVLETVSFRSVLRLR